MISDFKLTGQVFIKVWLDQELVILHLLQVHGCLYHFLELGEIKEQFLRDIGIKAPSRNLKKGQNIDQINHKIFKFLTSIRILPEIDWLWY